MWNHAARHRYAALRHPRALCSVPRVNCHMSCMHDTRVTTAILFPRRALRGADENHAPSLFPNPYVEVLNHNRLASSWLPPAPQLAPQNAAKAVSLATPCDPCHVPRVTCHVPLTRPRAVALPQMALKDAAKAVSLRPVLRVTCDMPRALQPATCRPLSADGAQGRG